MTYVAKDKRENRYCHVFDCGILSDDVLSTIGTLLVLGVCECACVWLESQLSFLSQVLLSFSSSCETMLLP